MEEAVKVFFAAFEQTRELTSAEVTVVLERLERLAWAVLSGHGGQFKEQWKNSAVSIVLRFILRVPLFRGTRAGSSVASKTSGSSLNSSKATGRVKSGLT